jgi:hypothetical protein
VNDPAIRAAIWGFLGAFIYAAPRWTACLATTRPTGHTIGFCTLELVTALLVGSVAAACFGRLALTFIHIADDNGVASVIGLLANTSSPMIVKRLSGIVAAAVGERIAAKEESQ